jgi:hypothetical protein
VKKITYIGTIGGGVEIDGGVVVETGDTVDVDDELAERLLEQEDQFVLAEQVDLETLDRAELLAIAESLGVEVAAGTKTKSLVAAIRDAQAAPVPPEPPEQAGPNADDDAAGIAADSTQEAAS